MTANDMSIPDRLPVLSRGKHRSPRKGACFMEFVSYLAGERWSDHPACTHPLLAAVARHVNDYISDAARAPLAVLTPSVIGLTSDDLHVDVRIALVSARAALPVVSADRQRVLAVAVLLCERLLDDLDGRPPGSLEEASRYALGDVPHAAEWARGFIRGQRTSSADFRRRAAPHIVACAVEGVARACIKNPDQMLHDLLVKAINECRALVGADSRDASGADAQAWGAACALTTTARRR